jgi:hypothetical protein
MAVQVLHSVYKHTRSDLITDQLLARTLISFKVPFQVPRYPRFCQPRIRLFTCEILVKKAPFPV